MKIFLDTNVLIDFLTGRDGCAEATEILALGQYKKHKLYASFLTFANIAYILRKYPTADVKKSISELIKVVKVLKMDEDQLKNALEMVSSDIEDNLQYQCADSADVDIIVTNNVKHFRFSEIRVMKPVEFIASEEI